MCWGTFELKWMSICHVVKDYHVISLLCIILLPQHCSLYFLFVLLYFLYLHCYIAYLLCDISYLLCAISSSGKVHTTEWLHNHSICARYTWVLGNGTVSSWSSDKNETVSVVFWVLVALWHADFTAPILLLMTTSVKIWSSLFKSLNSIWIVTLYLDKIMFV